MRTKNADIRIPTLTQFPLFSVIANFMKIKLRMLENFLEIWNIRYFLVVLHKLKAEGDYMKLNFQI